MLRYFNVEDYMTYVATLLFIVIGVNVSSYSLICLLPLINDFSFEEAMDKTQFYENAMIYVYGIILGLFTEAVTTSFFFSHGAKLGNKAKSGILGLLYKKVS